MSNFYTRMKAYREKFNLSQKELAEKVNIRRETVVRLERGQYNPSLKLAVDIAEEFQASVEDIFIFAENEREAAEVFQRKDAGMLEAGSVDLYAQAYQKGFEIGKTEASLKMLTTMIGYAKTFMSKEKWNGFIKSEEEKYRKYQKEHSDSKENYGRYYDNEGHFVKEKWIEEQKVIMECMGFPKEGWEDICSFIEKYPELPAGALARRIFKESEYKYV